MGGTNEETLALVPIRAREIDTAGGIDSLEYFVDCPDKGLTNRLDDCEKCPKRRGRNPRGDALLCAVAQAPGRSTAGNEHCPRCAASLSRTKVADVMARLIHCVDEDLPAPELAAIFERTRVRSLPVVDEDGGLLGVVTDRDLVRGKRRSAEEGEGEDPFPADLLGRTAADLMSAPAVALSSGASLADALERFRAHPFRALPVVGEAGEVVGMLTADELLRFLAERLFSAEVSPQPDATREAVP